jgi:hypothetical protein
MFCTRTDFSVIESNAHLQLALVLEVGSLDVVDEPGYETKPTNHVQPKIVSERHCLIGLVFIHISLIYKETVHYTFLDSHREITVTY